MASVPPEEQTIDKDGYQLTFYPGFASRCTVREANGTEYELYKQEKPYQLPNGQTKPRVHHTLRLKGGKRKQDVTLKIEDPEHRVARITVELYDENHVPGAGEKAAPVETVTVDQDSVTCPPNCP